MQEIEIALMIHLPDAVNSQRILAAIAMTFESNNFPPGLANVKGFTRHVVERASDDRSLSLLARVNVEQAKPTIMNMGNVLTAAASSVLIYSMVNEPNSISVETKIMIGDEQTGRVAVLLTSQGADDVKLQVDSSGLPTILAPKLQAAFNDTAKTGDVILLSPWDQSGNAFLEKAWAYLEAGYQTAN